MDDDNFFLNDDELGEDNALSIVDEAKLKAVSMIQKIANDLEGNIKYNESTDAQSNTELLLHHVNALLELQTLENQNVSNEELAEKIDEIFKSTTQLTYQNIKTVLKSEDDETDDNNSQSGTNYNNTDETDW